METSHEVDNTIYEAYGERWYTAQDDPVALLRAENKIKVPWILEQIRLHNVIGQKVLDVGCGGGFLSNDLARLGFKVTGVDLSPESLKVAEAHDETHSVKYEVADAFHLPYADESFDILTSMDFLEHIEKPKEVIQEFSRVLKPGGLFFFHTFNRNPLSWFVVIKLVEWFIKNTPKNMHVLRLFIKPNELENYCKLAQMKVLDITGLRPVVSSIDLKMALTGIVSKDMRFTLTGSKLISYLGVAKKVQGHSDTH